MPYHIEKQGDKHCVVKDSGKVMHCYSGDGAESKATQYMRALYANVQDSMFPEFSMAIVKTAIKDGEMRWRSVNSDTGKDFFGEQMSVELFKDMIARIEKGNEIPLAFKSAICEQGWCGGDPYISLAHYKAGENKVNVPGEVRSIYLDGDKLKSTGILYNNKLGQSVYRSLSKDIEEKRNENKVRISIGFLDLEHTHGDNYTFVRKSAGEKCPLCAEGVGDKIYRKGVLVHLALTRIPANPRTDMQVEKSMTTKLEDLKSIVDDPEVLEDLQLKSQADTEVLVVKSEDADADDQSPEDKKKKKKDAGEEMPMDKMPMKSTVLSEETPEPAPEPVAPVVVPEPTALHKSLSSFEESVLSVKSKGLVGEAALQELQGSFDQLAEVVRSEVAPSKPANAETNIESTLRSLLAELLPQAIAQSLAPIETQVSELRALSLAGSKQPAAQQEFVPQPRSLQVNLTQRAAIENVAKKGSFASLANSSVGLPDNFVR